MKCVPQSSRHHQQRQQLPSKKERRKVERMWMCHNENDFKLSSRTTLSPHGLGLADKFELWFTLACFATPHTTPGHWIIALFAWAKAPKSLRAILKIDIRYFFISFFLLPSRARSRSASVRFARYQKSHYEHDRHHRTHYWPLSRGEEIK